MIMSKNKKYWWLGIGTALWLLWGKTAYTTLNLGFKLVGIQLLSYNTNKTTLNLQIAIKNPTIYTLTIWFIRFKLSFNGIYIAEINQQINRKVVGKGVTTINIQTTINNNEVVNQLVNQLNSGIFDNWDIGLSGKVKVDNSYYPFSAVFFAEDLIPGLAQ